MFPVGAEELFGASAGEDQAEVDGGGLFGETLAQEFELGEEGFAYAAEADYGDVDLLGTGHCGGSLCQELFVVTRKVEVFSMLFRNEK